MTDRHDGSIPSREIRAIRSEAIDSEVYVR